MDTRFVSLHNVVEHLLRLFSRRISVFGSKAHGESTSQSDVDLLVALKPSEKRPPFGLFEVIRLKKELEKNRAAQWIWLQKRDSANASVRMWKKTRGFCMKMFDDNTRLGHIYEAILLGE